MVYKHKLITNKFTSVQNILGGVFAYIYFTYQNDYQIFDYHKESKLDAIILFF
jgi:hypothetical protein